jgi:hypothetical protein
MRLKDPRKIRRGAIIAYIAAFNVFLLAMVAIAIDIGMVAVAKAQAQNAADVSAMAGVRTFNGQSGYNLTNAPINAVTAATQNKIFSSAVTGNPASIANPIADTYTSGSVMVECGGYYYIYNDANPSTEGFQIVIPGKSSTEPYTAVRTTITTTSPIFFGSIWGASPFNVIARAVAAHRPRDTVIIMDVSGSMRFQTCPGAYTTGGYMYPHWGPRNISLNPDANFPVFGHYSATATAALQGTTSGSTGVELVDPSNLAVNWPVSGPPCLADFMTSGSTPAFGTTPISQAVTPGGDNYLKSGGNYIKTVTDLLGASPTAATQLAWCRNGYPQYNGNVAFNGYTEGPTYWGKTFFIWPPDPRGSDLDPSNAANHANNGAKDWRQRFFFKQNVNTGAVYWLDQNTVLFDPKGSPCTVDSSGVTPILKDPDVTTTVTENGASVNYSLCINYAAIFQWLKNTAPTHFPASMTTGRINYYSKIPDPTGDLNFNNRFWTQSPMTDLSERFWKDYVDFMLGYVETGPNSYSNNDGSNPWSSYIGNGDFFQWGTVQLTQKQDNNYKATINNAAGYAAGATSIKFNTVQNASSGSSVTLTTGTTYYVRFGYGTSIYSFVATAPSSGTYTVTLDVPLTVAVANSSLVKIYTAVPQYMNYTDNPYRPRHQYWFGPQSWGDWLGNYSVYQYPNGIYTLRWPANTHEAQAWTCKVGISAAIDDIKNNHPNDFVALSFFSSPSYSTSGGGQFNTSAIPLGRNYQGMKDSLWFPPTTVTGSATTITPYDPDFANVPRAKGGTTPQMGLMIAFNLLSSSATNLRLYATPTATYRGLDGGLGRKGASRLVVFETDGAPNTRAVANLSGSGSDSYYPIRIKDPTNIANAQNEFPTGGSYADSEVYSVVQQMCAMNTASPPGFSTSRKPCLVYGVGYGSMFDPANASNSGQPHALSFLQTVQYYGNVSPDTNGNNFPDWQRIYGDNNTRLTRLRTAFTNIMQSGVQVSLLQ